MAKAKLSSYIKRIESKYIVAREEYEEKAKELETIEEEYSSKDKSIYTAEGQNQLFTEKMEREKKVTAELENIRENFLKASQEIIEESDKVFDRKYCYTPEDVDSNGLAILNSGNLSAREIMQLGERYRLQGNSTMYFMCGDLLKDDNNPEIMKWYSGLLNAKQRKDHDLLNAHIVLCENGLRGEDAKSGRRIKDAIMLSNGIHTKMHESGLKDHLLMAEQITVDVNNPWE